MDLTDVYTTFHANRKDYLFFSAPHGIFLKIDHILGNKASIHRFKKNGITTCVLAVNHGVKLEFNNNFCISHFKQIAKAEQSQQRQRGQMHIFKSVSVGLSTLR